MKKLLVFILTLLIALSLVACGGAERSIRRSLESELSATFGDAVSDLQIRDGNNGFSISVRFSAEPPEHEFSEAVIQARDIVVDAFESSNQNLGSIHLSLLNEDGRAVWSYGSLFEHTGFAQALLTQRTFIGDAEPDTTSFHGVSIYDLYEYISTFDRGDRTLFDAVRGAIISLRLEVNNVTANDATGVVTIELQGQDNLTTNLIRQGMFMRTRDILQSLQDRDDIEIINLHWYFPLVDAHGNSNNSRVLSLSFNRPTIDRINFDTIDYNNLPDIADFFNMHSAMQ